MPLIRESLSPSVSSYDLVIERLTYGHVAHCSTGRRRIEPLAQRFAEHCHRRKLQW